MRKPKAPPEVSFDGDLTMLKRAVEEAFARRPPGRAPDPMPELKTAAERYLFHAEMAYRLQAVLCRDPGRCAKHRCRRLSHCRELKEIGRLV